MLDDEKLIRPVSLGRGKKPNAFEDRADFRGSAARAARLRRAVWRFGGSAATSLALTPVKLEIYNDADGRLADFFRALADDKALEKMKRYAAAFPQSRVIYDKTKRDWIKSPELAKRGFAMFYVQSFSFGGKPFDSFGDKKNAVLSQTAFFSVNFLAIF